MWAINPPFNPQGKAMAYGIAISVPGIVRPGWQQRSKGPME
jgi:hypothetical protein